MGKLKIIGGEEILFVYKRKHYVGIIEEGKTVWSVTIRHKRDFLSDGWIVNKSQAKTAQQALDIVFENVKHKI